MRPCVVLRWAALLEENMLPPTNWLTFCTRRSEEGESLAGYARFPSTSSAFRRGWIVRTDARSPQLSIVRVSKVVFKSGGRTVSAQATTSLDSSLSMQNTVACLLLALSILASDDSQHYSQCSFN